MTVAIAALCDGGKACVVAADRQITAAVGLEFEHPASKIETLGGCAVVSAGDALLAAQVIERSREKLAGSSHDARRVADTLRETYMALHIERVERGTGGLREPVRIRPRPSCRGPRS